MPPRVSHVMLSPLWKSWLLGAVATETAPRNSTGVKKSYGTTAYLVKMSTPSQNYYIWQVNENKPM